MLPQDLYNLHVERAEKIATSLCWRYRVSGALFYQEEARSESRLALWRACRNFDPGLQELEIRKIRESQSTDFWSPLFGSPPSPRYDHQNPYDNFWIWAVRQIYGRIIDWFRSYHLIKRMAKDEKPSMVYHERFISMTRAKFSPSPGAEGNDHERSDFDECLPSNDRADGYDDVEDKRKELQRLMIVARPTKMEVEALSLAYGNDELGKVEISEVLGITPAAAASLLKSALGKLRLAAHPECEVISSLSCLTTLSIERPMLRPGI